MGFKNPTGAAKTPPTKTWDATKRRRRAAREDQSPTIRAARAAAIAAAKPAT